jgi:hypothetical protein
MRKFSSIPTLARLAVTAAVVIGVPVSAQAWSHGVPEPGTLSLFAFGLSGLGAYTWRPWRRLRR